MTLTILDLLRICLWAMPPGLVILCAKNRDDDSEALTDTLAYFLCLFYAIAAYTAGTHK